MFKQLKETRIYNFNDSDLAPNETFKNIDINIKDMKNRHDKLSHYEIFKIELIKTLDGDDVFEGEYIIINLNQDRIYMFPHFIKYFEYDGDGNILNDVGKFNVRDNIISKQINYTTYDSKEVIKIFVENYLRNWEGNILTFYINFYYNVYEKTDNINNWYKLWENKI